MPKERLDVAGRLSRVIRKRSAKRKEKVLRYDPDRDQENFLGMVQTFIFGSSDEDDEVEENAASDQEAKNDDEPKWKADVMRKPLIDQWVDDYWYV